MLKKLTNIFNSKRPPRNLRTITFKDCLTRGLYGFCLQRYRFGALGDTWMTAKRQKNDSYNLYIYSHFMTTESKLIAACQTYAEVKDLMEEFEQALKCKADFGPGIFQYHREKTRRHFSHVKLPTYGN